MSEQSQSKPPQRSIGCGCSFGSIVASLLSIKSWGFTWWLLLHFPLGWGYVAYWVIFRSGWIR